MRNQVEKPIFEQYLGHTLNISDKILTLFALRVGFRELNPIINFFVNFGGILVGILLAGVLGFFGMQSLYKNKHYKVLRVVCGVYLAVVIANLTQLLVYYGG